MPLEPRTMIETLAEELDMEARFGWSWGEDLNMFSAMGNGFLSRLPIVDFEERSMKEHEMAILHNQVRLEINLPGGRALNIYNSHPPYRSYDAINRETQAAAMARWVDEREQHAVSPIWCGDFNSSPTSSAYRFMTGEQSRQGVSTCWTHLSSVFNGDNPLLTIGEERPRDACLDYVFQRRHTHLNPGDLAQRC